MLKEQRNFHFHIKSSWKVHSISNICVSVSIFIIFLFLDQPNNMTPFKTSEEEQTLFFDPKLRFLLRTKPTTQLWIQGNFIMMLSMSTTKSDKTFFLLFWYKQSTNFWRKMLNTGVQPANIGIIAHDPPQNNFNIPVHDMEWSAFLNYTL